MTEKISKIILETEYKVTGVDVSVQKLTEYQKATDGITTASLEKVAADKKVEQAANQLNKVVETQTKVQTDLAKSIKETGKAMNTIAQTNSMKDAFDGSAVKDLDAQLKAFVQTARSAKSIDELTQSMDEFVASLPKEIQGDVFKLLQKETAKLEKTLVNPVMRLRELKRLINTETDPVLLKEYTKEAGKLQDELGDTNDLVKALASDTFFADTVVEGAQQAVGAFTAFQGILALTTEDQEEFAKAAAKAQGALALLQGTQQIITNLKKSDNIVTRVQIVTQQIYSKVVGTSTGALKGFKLALAATGIGLAVIAIAALVANWDKLAEAIGLTNKQRSLNDSITKKAIDNYAQEAGAIEVAKSRLQDSNISQEERIRIINELKETYPGYLQNIDAETSSYEDVKKALDDVNDALLLKAKIDATQELLTEALTKQLKAQNTSLEDNLDIYDKTFAFLTGLSGVNEEAVAKLLGAKNVGETVKETQEDIDNYLLLLKDFQDQYANIGGDPAAPITNPLTPPKPPEPIKDKILEGSIEALEAEISRYEKIKSRLTEAGSEASLAAQKEIDIRRKQLEDIKKLYETPVDIELFTEGSLNALQKQVNDLNDIVFSLGEGPERDAIVVKLNEAQAALAAAKERAFGKEVEQAKEQNGVLFEEEERHQLAMQGIEGDSAENQLKTQLSYAKERLKILQESGTATEDELTKQANTVAELDAKIKKSDEEKKEEIRKQQIELFKQNIRDAIALTDQLLGIEADKYARLADLQQERVNEALAIADKGNVALLELEEKRLADLNSKREAFVKKQQALAQIQLISESMLAVAKAAAEGGPLAPFTIAATLLALASGLAQARAAAQQQSFRKGGVFEGGYTGYGAEGVASNQLGAKPYEYHYQEHIMPAPVTKIGNNLKWLEKIRMERIDIGRLINEKRGSQVIVAPNGEAPNVTVNNTFKLNSRGIISIVEEAEKNRKRINSKR